MGESLQGWHHVTSCPTWTIRNDSSCSSNCIRKMVLCTHRIHMYPHSLQTGQICTLANHTQLPPDTKGRCSAKARSVSVSDLNFFICTMKGLHSACKLMSRKFQGASSYRSSDCQLSRETECPHLRTPWEAISSYENPIHFLRKKVLIFLAPNRSAQLYHERSKSNTKCCSLITGSRAPRSTAIPSFPGSSIPLLRSWLGSSSHPPS